MAIQPAMLLYLDNDANVKGAPNQNFARELMELFLLGVGNYTEADIIASAQAWTGHGIDTTIRNYKFDPTEHDNTNKTFFGTTKNWNGPDIITEILTNPTKKVIAAKFITTKLWSFFAYPNPSDTLVSTLANVFTSSNWNIKSLRAGDVPARRVLVHHRPPGPGPQPRRVRGEHHAGRRV